MMYKLKDQNDVHHLVTNNITPNYGILTFTVQYDYRLKILKSR